MTQDNIAWRDPFADLSQAERRSLRSNAVELLADSAVREVLDGKSPEQVVAMHVEAQEALDEAADLRVPEE